MFGVPTFLVKSCSAIPLDDSVFNGKTSHLSELLPTNICEQVLPLSDFTDGTNPHICMWNQKFRPSVYIYIYTLISML